MKRVNLLEAPYTPKCIGEEKTSIQESGPKCELLHEQNSENCEWSIVASPTLRVYHLESKYMAPG